MEEQSSRETHDQKYDVDAYWARDNEVVEKIIDQGAETYFQDIDMTRTGEIPERVCACIDERVGGAKLAIPGSGILYGLEKAYKILKETGTTSISSHEDCGAAVLAFEGLSDKEKKYYGSADAYAKEFTDRLATKLGIRYDGHMKVETPGLHVARAIYYDDSGNFRADAERLPRGFTVDRQLSSSGDAQANLELAITIAMGGHGFGERFTEKTPLLIIPIGEADALVDLQKEIENVIQKNSSWAGRIKVDDGLTVKSEEEEKVTVLN